MSEVREHLVERSRQMIEAWNDSGPDGLGEFLSVDVVLIEREDVLERDTILGREAVIARYHDRLALVGPSKAAIRSVELVAANRVVVDMDLHFEGRVSGVEGEFKMVHLYTWHDGLVARIEEFADTASARSLLGAWRLVEWTATSESETLHPSGEDATGRIIYSADGYMSAFLARADGYTDALAYSGTWELGGDEVVHHVSLSTRESFVGKDLVRTVSWEGADLVLTTPESRDGWVNQLRWRRESG